MKKLIVVLTACLLGAPSWGSPAAESSYDILRAGTRQVERLRNANGKDFLLSNVIFPKQKRQVNVLAYLSISFLRFTDPIPSDYLEKNPGYQKAIEEMFFYVTQAWSDWQQAANAWLPAKYRLPDLKFTLKDGYKTDINQPTRWTESTLNLAVEASAGKYGFYLSGVDEPIRGVGRSAFTTKGDGFGLIQFFMEQEWVDYLNAPTPAAQAAAAEHYKKAAAAQMAGELYDAANAGRATLSAEAQKYVDILSQSPADTWYRQGPWAQYNQQIMTHEMGHLFGLTHIHEDSSIMAPSVEFGGGKHKPSAQDGQRLATLVCWYHNQRAKRQVCVPLGERSEAKQIKRAVQNHLLRLQKIQDGASLSAAAGVQIPSALPQTMDVKSFEPQTTQAPKTKKKALVFQAQAPVQPNPADYQHRRADAQKKTAKFQSQAPVSANAADYQTAKSGKTGSARTLNFQPQAPVKNNAEPDTMSHPAIQSRVPQMPAPLTRTKNQNPDPLSSVPAHSRPQAAAAALPAQPACFICGK